MNKKVLIVEDQFIEANDLQIMLRRAGYEVCGIARSVDIALQMIAQEKPGLVLLDIFLKGELTGIDLARTLKEKCIAFIFLSANSNEEILAAVKKTEPYGFVVKPFREKDLLVTLEIARYRHEQTLGSRYRREADVIKQLEGIGAKNGDQNSRLLQMARIIQQEISFDYFTVGFGQLEKHHTTAISFLRIGFDEYQTIGLAELSRMVNASERKLASLFSASNRNITPVFFNNDEFQKVKLPQKGLIQEMFQMKSLLSFPIQFEQSEILDLCFYGRRPDTYSPEHISLLYKFQSTLMQIINGKPGNVDQPMKVASSRNNFTNSMNPMFEGMIGNSHLLLNVFDLMVQVAPFDTAVLVMGESGTGKERIAESIHNLSPRKRKPFVKLNCATLPDSLIESELFGHEKGSFTGATDKRTGKFEQANGGTIFLDEIGEMPIDLQVKLLRVLQEKEIEPIGGKGTVKIDVRVIAATNRNLEKEVGEGRFRLDLYYRLNVFPITLPPLRDRLEDLSILTDHFISIYNRKAGKTVAGVSDNVLKSLMNYSWPGNIRELENLIERGVLLAKGTTIDDVFLPDLQSVRVSTKSQSVFKTIHENERDYIISVLKQCAGKVWGAGGAAEMLGVPPSTLKSKMKKLGIEK